MAFSRKYFIFSCLFLLSFFCRYPVEATLPEIGAKDVTVKIHEFMKAHAKYKKPTPLIAQRVLVNFLEELDPAKTYLIYSEVEQWLEPTDESIKQVLATYENSDYSFFFEMHNVMVKAINRRNLLEERIEETELPKDVKVEEFKDLDWAKDEGELFNRLLRIKALRLESAQKFDEEQTEKILKRMKKRRFNFEEDILLEDPVEKERFVFSLILKATAAALDAHTAFFTPGEATQFLISVQKRLFGIGAQLRDDLNGFTVVKVIEGGPAGLAKELKAKDLIVAVDREPVVGMDIYDVVDLIRGEEGTSVLLSIIRESKEEGGDTQTIDIEIIRGEVVLSDTRISADYDPFGDGVVAIVKLHSFYQDPHSSSASDLLKELDKIKEEHNLKGVVLDLRYNSGGMLTQAVEVSGLFITKGIVVGIKDSDEKIQYYRDVDGVQAWEGPLIVLTNRASASASEIVAQTLQDYGRAIVVGDDHTFGKGTFQTFSLDTSQKGSVNPQGEYKVTRGRYYTVSGKSPQLIGVTPAIHVPGILSEIDYGEKTSKFPLENDNIKENFDDDLSDIPYIHREQLARLYRYNLQEKLTIYNKHLDILKKNSARRIENNKNYQNFLAELKKKDDDEEEMEFGRNDLQLEEALNIMKDLLYLMG